jgi:hypothetical protein
LYVLVYVGVLHYDEPVQLAYENRIVPLPDLRWQSDANAYSNSNTDANSYTDTNADA